MAAGQVDKRCRGGGLSTPSAVSSPLKPGIAPDLLLQRMGLLAGEVMWSSLQLGALHLAVLPPRDSAVRVDSSGFPSQPPSPETQIADIQRFRGRIYFQDGAIPEGALDEVGRHRSESDPFYWHLSMMDAAGAIQGCLRLRLVHPASNLHALEAYRVLARMEPASRSRFVRVLEHYTRQALADGLAFGEVGGLAVTEELRRSKAALILIVACWAIARRLGGMIAVASVTVRHGSAAMLHRIGAFPFDDVEGILSPFYDPYYRCPIEMLAFDSRKLASEFEPLVEQIGAQLLFRHEETWLDRGTGRTRAD